MADLPRHIVSLLLEEGSVYPTLSCPTMVDLRPHSARQAAGYPLVRGWCPACSVQSLFLAAGNWITCANLYCPDPMAAGKRLGAE